MPTSTHNVYDSLSNPMIQMKHSCATQTQSSDLTSLHQKLTEDFLNQPKESSDLPYIHSEVSEDQNAQINVSCDLF